MKVNGFSSVYQYEGGEYDFDQKGNKVGRIEGVPSDVELGVDKVDDNTICYFTSLDADKDYAASYFVMNDDVLDEELKNGHWVVEYNPTSAIVYSVFYSEDKIDVAKEYVKDYDTFDAKYRYRDGRLETGAYIGYFGGGSAQSSTTKDRLVVGLSHTNEEKLIETITCNIPESIDGNDYPVIILNMTDEYGGSYTKYFYYSSMSLSYEDKVTSNNKINSKEEWLTNREAYTSLNIKNNQITINFSLDELTSKNTRFSKKFDSLINTKFVDGAGSKLTIKATAIVPGNNLIVTGYSKRDFTNSLFADESTNDTAVIKYARHLQNLDLESGVNSDIKNVIQQKDISLVGSDITNFKPIENTNIKSFIGSYDGINYKISDLKIGVNNGDAGLFKVITTNTSFKDVTLVGSNVKATASSSGAGSLVGRIKNTNVTIENCEAYLTPVQVDGKTNQDVWISGKDAAGGLIGVVESGSVNITNSSAATVIGAYTYSGSGDNISVTHFNTSSVGGLIGRVSSGTINLNKTFSDSYLVGATAGGLIGNSSSSSVSTTIKNSYAAGFLTYDTRAAGIVLGSANVSNSYTVIDRLYMDSLTKKYYRVSMSGDSDNAFFIMDNISVNVDNGEKVLNKSDDDLVDDLNKNGTSKAIFTGSISYNVAYNLSDMISPNYSYPSIINLQHHGDSKADFGSFVYFEKYSDGTYGFYSSGIKSTLNNSDSVNVVGDGYGLAYSSVEDRQVAIKIESTGIDYEEVVDLKEYHQVNTSDGSYYIYPLPTGVVNKDFVLNNSNPNYFLKITIKTSGDESYYFFNPYFAKTVVSADANAKVSDITFNQDGDLISIRSSRHLYNLAKYYDKYSTQTTVCTFNQERNIDYKNYDFVKYVGIDNTDILKPIAGKGNWFSSGYNGNYHTINNINIIATDETNVGLFGRVSTIGYLKNIVLRAAYSNNSDSNYYATRKSPIINNIVNMGTLVGFNSGTITNCSVDGFYFAGDKGTIQTFENSTLYVGGLVGLNTGTITNSAVDLPAMQLASTYANVKMGGFVGVNRNKVSDCYTVGNLKVISAKGGNVVLAGFSGDNTGTISNSYCSSALSGTGDSSIYGFSPIGGGFSNCEYLCNGSYHFLGGMYSYNAEQPGSAIKAVNYSILSVNNNDLRKATSSFLYGETSANKNKTYPFPCVVKDANGKYVHYGDWVKEAALGNTGLFYWEKEVDGENNGYHITLIGIQNDGTSFSSFVNSTLCNSHDDGGIISSYGYGYFTNLDVSKIDFGLTNVSDNNAHNQEASNYITQQFPGYSFVAYTTRDPYSISTDGLALSGDKNTTQGKAQISYTNNGVITSYEFSFTPFFANSMSLDRVTYDLVNVTSTIGIENYVDYMGVTTNYKQKSGTANNQFEIRNAAQLQYLNWNSNTKNTSTWYDDYSSSVPESWKSFPYLGYVDGANFERAKAKYYFNQSHDINAKMNPNGTVLFTPIGSMFERGDGTNSNVVSTYFNGTYNGNSYVIKNLEINSASQCVGLFGVTISADIQNMILYSDQGNNISTSISAISRGDKNWYCVGGLAGVSTVGSSNTGGNAIFKNCTVSGYNIKDIRKVDGYGGTNIGGFVGMTNVNITNCSSVCDIDINVGYSNGSRNIRVGGLAGNFRGQALSNCYSGGSITATKTDANKDTNVHIAGFVGGCYVRENGNLATIFGPLVSKPTISNVYTYTNLNGNSDNDKVITVAQIASKADYSNNNLSFEISDAYYLDQNTTYKYKNGFPDGSNISYEAVSYEMLASEEMYNKLTGDYLPVTTIEEATGANVDGKYSFGGSNKSLMNKNYPFPTVLRQQDSIYGNTVNVHYGEWPTISPYWENGRDTLDIFTNLKDLNESQLQVAENEIAETSPKVASKVFKLYTNGKDLGTISSSDFTQGTDADLVQIIPDNNKKTDAKGEYYEITMIPLTAGVKTIKFNKTVGEETYNVSFALEVTANLYVNTSVETLNINQGDASKNFTLGLQKNGESGKETISLNGKWSISSSPNGIVKISNDNTTFVDSYENLDSLNTIHVKRNELGSSMVTTNFTYKYIVKTLDQTSNKYVNQLDDQNNQVTLTINAIPAYVDIVQDDFVGLSNKVNFNVAYLVPSSTDEISGQAGTYSSAIPSLDLTDKSNFFFYIGKDKNFNDFSIVNTNEGSETTYELSINDIKAKKVNDEYVITDTEKNLEYHISLDDFSSSKNEKSDSHYKYKTASIYCLTTDQTYDLNNKMPINLKTKILNNGITYVLSCDLNVDVRRKVVVTYQNGENQITENVLTGDYIPDTKKVTVIPDYKKFVGWIKKIGDVETSLEINELDNITSDVTYIPVFDFIKPTLYANGGEFTDFLNRIEVEMNEESNGQFNLSSYSPTREGHTLIGWSKVQNTTKDYETSGTVTITDLGSDYSLYAVWRENGTNVILDVVEETSYSIKLNISSNQITYKTYAEDKNLIIDDKKITGWKLPDSGLQLIVVGETNSLSLVAGVEGYTNADGEWIYENESLQLEPILEQIVSQTNED